MANMTMIHLTLVILLGAASNAQSAPINLRCRDARRMQLARSSDLMFVDVRDADSFSKGHIQGARNIPASAIAAASIPANAALIVYCGEASCPLSAAAADKLDALGYKNVYLLSEGFNEWLKEGYPAAAGNGTVMHPHPGWLNVREAHRQIEHGMIVVVDTRTPLEYAAGHIAGAMNLPLETIGTSKAVLPANKALLVYDRLDSRSVAAAQQLMAAGYTVYELAGGLPGWIQKQYPLEVK